MLILGSLPGRRSLEMQQYYALSQNAFWGIMARLFDIDSVAPYPERLERLRAQRIALWDVCHSAIRPGSLDAAIEQHSVRANDFASFFAAHEAIRGVYFNGAKAASLYERLVLPTLPAHAHALRRVILPSTSPAHASMSFAIKLRKWTEVRRGAL